MSNLIIFLCIQELRNKISLKETEIFELTKEKDLYLKQTKVYFTIITIMTIYYYDHYCHYLFYYNYFSCHLSQLQYYNNFIMQEFLMVVNKLEEASNKMSTEIENYKENENALKEKSDQLSISFNKLCRELEELKDQHEILKKVSKLHK